MLWELRYEDKGFSIEAGLKKGRAPGKWSEWYFDKPELLDGEGFYLEAFGELSTTRQFGMGPGPIPWNWIVHYAERHDMDEVGIQQFTAIIREMDRTYLDWQDRKSKRRSTNQRSERQQTASTDRTRSLGTP